MFAAWEESKLSATDFAGKHGFDAQRLYWWRRRLGDGGRVREERAAFAEVVVQTAPNAVIERVDSRLEIIFPSGVSIRVAAPFDEGLVRDVLRIVREAGAC